MATERRAGLIVPHGLVKLRMTGRIVDTENGIHLGSLAGMRVTCGTLFGGKSAPEPLRQKIVAKNQLFFHRWRPQNETYLFGFRKHEQGKNAAEVAAFDPLVAAAEEKIWTLNK